MPPDDGFQENGFRELTPFEAALAALKPRAAEPDRETLFFQAGQAAALRDLSQRRPALTRWGWPAAFSAMTAVAATLLAMLCLRAALGPTLLPTGAAPAVAVALPEGAILPERESQQADPAAGIATYSRLRADFLLKGIDGFTPEKIVATDTPVISAAPLPYCVLRDQFLQEK